LRSLLTYLKGDKAIWIIAILFAIISVVCVFSFVANMERYGYYLVKHSIMFLTGLVLMFYAHQLKFRYYSRLSVVFIWAAGILLFLTLVTGVNTNNAARWLEIPIIHQRFQTSDLAKVALLLYVARMLSMKKEALSNFREGVLPTLIPTIIICGLILPENFSTAAMLFSICMIMMFVAGVSLKHLMSIIGSALAAFMLLLLIASSKPDLLPRLDTWSNRMLNFSAEEPAESWQSDAAKAAIYNGQFFGKGPSKGQSKYRLAQASSDFFFASFVEEFGLAGCIGIILLYMVLLFRIIRIAIRCEKRFGSYLAIGLGLNIIFPALINMGVSSGLLPVTGQNMPMLGLGGTSTWFTCISLGIILSVSRSVYQQDESTNNKLSKPVITNNEEEGQYATA